MNNKNILYHNIQRKKIIFDNFNYPTNQVEWEKLKAISSKWQVPISTFRNLTGSCGDILHLLIKARDNYIEKIYFSGQQSCLLTISSCNILSSYLENKDLTTGRKIITNFQSMLKGGKYFLDNYPNLQVFSDMPRFPHRRECVNLAVEGIVSILFSKIKTN
jgi:NifU-like protein involved in Fe-S cluster formation